MNVRTILRPIAFTLAFLAAATVVAPEAAGQSRAKAKLYVRADGDDVKAAVEIRVESGFHIGHGPTTKDSGEYMAPTTFTMVGEGFEWSPARYPEAEKEADGIAPDSYIYVHYGTVTFWLHGRRTTADADVAGLAVKIEGQTCDPKGCVPYGETVKSSGAGTDALFAKFPADLPAPGASPAAPPRGAMPLHAHAKLFVRASGDDVKAAVEISIDPKFHLYHGPDPKDVGSKPDLGKPTTVELIGAGFTWSAPRFPKPEVADLGFGPMNLHAGTLVLYLRGKLAAGGDPSKLQAKLAGQTCDDRSCTDYDETVAGAGAGPDALFAAFPADLAVGGAAGAAGSTSKSGAGDSSPLGLGLWAFLGSAVAWGLFCLLMPCTYPMIPITISYFTKQSHAHKGSLLPLSLCYGLGIVLVYIVIGVAFGKVIIPFATHWVTNLVIGGFFLLFALSLFGVILLQPPQFLMKAATSATRQGGYLGVFLMGTTLVVTSFTCTAPFVGSLLAAGARSGNLGRVALGMGVFGLTMAVPFVFLALLPGKVKQMPKAGEWSHTLKVTLGFIEIAAALKFISNVDLVLQWGALPRELFLLLWSSIFLLAALYLFGVIRLSDDREPVTIEPGVPVDLHQGVSPKRMLSALTFFLLGVYMLCGALGNELDWVTETMAPTYSRPFVGDGAPAAVGSNGATSESESLIVDDWEAAVARAKAERKLLAVNFTGFT